jgi:adenylosuccinate synthase
VAGWTFPSFYTDMNNGYTAVALTKLDILDKREEIKIGVKYRNKDG